jgi:geranylgeranyl pyrophosphate synthase
MADSSATKPSCDFDKILRETPGHEANLGILEPFLYIADLPGKDIRGKLIECFNLWLRVPPERVDDVKQIIGALHNASLLIDDIEDSSKLRRGVPVAHSIFGVPLTINCANYVYFLALSKIQELGIPRAMNVFVIELLSLHRGQGLDILWRDQNVCPSGECVSLRAVTTSTLPHPEAVTTSTLPHPEAVTTSTLPHPEAVTTSTLPLPSA